jgi:hypothetical protein
MRQKPHTARWLFESLPQFRLLLKKVLDEHRLESLAGCVTVAMVRGIRIRRGS